MKEISSGAEAKIFLDNGIIIKDRIRKSYRIPEIDGLLRESRTRKEAKILTKLFKLGIAPKLEGQDKSTLKMEYIDGIQLKQALESRPELSENIGTNLTLMHDNNIVHGDLTTSNMILKGEKIYFIDFGLSFTSTKIEDKAVDIHLFKQALESRHFKVMDNAYKNFLKGYNPKDREKILERLVIVERRGRYKEKT
jgi:TP53 regulating kinase-like protein